MADDGFHAVAIPSKIKTNASRTRQVARAKASGRPDERAFRRPPPQQTYFVARSPQHSPRRRGVSIRRRMVRRRWCVWWRVEMGRQTALDPPDPFPLPFRDSNQAHSAISNTHHQATLRLLSLAPLRGCHHFPFLMRAGSSKLLRSDLRTVVRSAPPCPSSTTRPPSTSASGLCLLVVLSCLSCPRQLTKAPGPTSPSAYLTIC